MALGTLTYVYAVQVMPKWAFDKLQSAISTLLDNLENLEEEVMGFFYVTELDRKRISRVLKQWQQPPLPWYTGREQRRRT